MKTLLLLFFSLNLYSQIPQIPQDKLLHFSAGYIVSTGVTAFADKKGYKNPELYGLFAGFAAGIIKELIDTNPDPMDAYFTMWGSSVGCAIITIPINNKKIKY
jgi:hypothetical protein